MNRRQNKRSILFYISHPALFFLYKQTIKNLQQNHRIMVTYKKKEVLEELVETLDCEIQNIFPEERGDSQAHILYGIFIRNRRILKVAKNINADLIIGTAPEVSQVAKLLRIPAIIVNDTDYNAAPWFAWLTYPFADCILAPQCCDVNRWADRVIRYPGCHPAAYLHPRYFQPNTELVQRINPTAARYFILRLVKLSAHHDRGKGGINDDLALDIVRILEPYGQVFISSERTLSDSLQPHQLHIAAHELHSILAACDLLITDGQTVAAEAAALATRSIAYNDFIGVMGYLQDLERKYNLTIGLQANQPQLLLQTVKETVETVHDRKLWQTRRKQLFAEATDIPRLLTWLIENYPDSAATLRKQPSKLKDFALND